MSLKTNDLFSVRGKNIVVTGGSRGIGIMITKTLVTNGAKVFITARKANELNDAVKLLNGIAPGSAVGIQGDVSTDAECKRIVSEVAKHTGKVHALFNNAGITWGGSMEEYQEQAWNKVNSVNVAAIFHLTRAFIPLLEAAATKDETAKVINVASIAGLSTSKFDNAYAYAASKAAVLILTRTLAVQLSDKGISVNAICPGVFPSKMSKYFTDDDTRREFALATIPLGRFGNEEDMGGIALFLASKASGYMTGTHLVYDGGQTAGARL